MARGMLGKPRSPPQTQGISQPRLRYTDALPRSDLRDIDRGVSYSRPIHQPVKGAQYSNTSQGRDISRATNAPPSGFDFHLTAPPNEPLRTSDTPLGVDEAMIGIALGSPRLLEPRNMPSQKQRLPPPTPPDDESPPSALQRKSSKWRKIGGLFKAKNALASNANTIKPFYQVRAPNDNPHQGSTHSVDYKSRRRPGTKTGPIENTEVWPCLVSENEALAHKQDSSKPKVPGSFLQVEIPQVEMERYSVMFGGLLNNNRPSLLDRRSKTLDNVTIPGRGSPPPLGPPQRRATSPAPSRSPNFTLFPTMPSSKASKVLGTQNLPQAPNHLRRPQTSPEDAPHKRLSDEKNQRTLTPDNRSQTRSSHRPQASVTSFLSATSIGSDDEPLLIHKVEPVRTYAGMKEPNWDIINRKAPSGNPKELTVNTRELRSDSNSTTGSIGTAKSSPILSPLVSSRPVVSPSANETALFPPPRTTSRRENVSIPAIEVSVARSVSVSKGKKQVIVPVKPRANQWNSSNERLVARQAKTPTVTNPQYGHRPGLSQDVRIETA